VGDGVSEFRPNDRVAAFHEMYAPHGAFAEYAIAWAYTSFCIPPRISFEEAATVLLASMTAAVGMYSNLKLSPPWTTDEDHPETGPLLIYGTGTAVGSFAVQFAIKSRIHPIICVAGQSKDHVESLIDRQKGDVIIDYHLGPKAVIASIDSILGEKPLLHAFDAMSEHGSDIIVGAVLDPKLGILAMALPKDRTKIPKQSGVSFPENFAMPQLKGVPEGGEAFWTAVGSVHNGLKHLSYVFYRYVALGLEEGWFRPHPHEVVPDGLEGLEAGLTRLFNGEAHGTKFVYQISG
jgi:NADPH:quinone reductase-like Zn-dependent oxidoreductase